ncbi:MAG: response regulator, partial [Anaerolineae bacterium]|nr:response regulator [Anaerolineae bacterium]
LDQFDPSNGTAVRHRHRPNDPASVGPGVITCIQEDEAGGLWVGQYNGGGLSRFDRQRGQFDRYTVLPDAPHQLGDGTITALVSDRADGLWIGTERAGLFHFDRTTAVFSHYHPQADAPYRLSHPHVTDIMKDRAGQLWIATTDGLNRLDQSGPGVTHYRPGPDNATGLVGSRIVGLFEDRSQGLWVATTKGVNYCAPRYPHFWHYTNSALLAHIRHELRTPLNGIIGFSQLAMHPDAQPAETQNYLREIIHSGEQLLALINQIFEPADDEQPQSLSTVLPAPTEEPDPTLAGQPLAGADDRRCRVLLVDDDSTNRQQLRQALVKVGPSGPGAFVFREADNGQQAVELWQTFAPHLIWLDLRMPVMDGYEAARIIRTEPNAAHNVTPQIIVLSTSSYDEKRAELLNIGYDAIVRKPVGEADIVAVLRQHGAGVFEPPPNTAATAAPAPALDEAALAAGLAAIPASLRAKLEGAAQSGDFDAVETTIAEIRSLQPALAAYLARLADAFDYLHIVAVVQRRNDD